MNENNPDYHIELFWLNFKKSLINYYNGINLNRPIEYWSNELNKLQELKKYDLIENKIKNFISLFAIDLMRNLEHYHIRILLTNIKRWNKISILHNFQSNLENYHNIIFLLLDIYKSMLSSGFNKESELIFNQIELLILWKDFSSIIEYSIKNKKLSIIDKINKFDPKLVNNHIENIYNIKINNILSAKKIYKLINNKD